MFLCWKFLKGTLDGPKYLYFLTFYSGWRGPKCLFLGCLFHSGGHTGFFTLLGDCPWFCLCCSLAWTPPTLEVCHASPIHHLKSAWLHQAPPLFFCFEAPRSEMESPCVPRSLSLHSQPYFVRESLCWAKPLNQQGCFVETAGINYRTNTISLPLSHHP